MKKLFISALMIGIAFSLEAQDLTILHLNDTKDYFTTSN